MLHVACLFVSGNMWAQTWGNIYELVEPYPGKKSVDATPEMVAQVYKCELSRIFLINRSIE